MAAFFLLGLLPYIYEPAAAFRGPAYNYGDPFTATRWFQHVTLHHQRGGLFGYPLQAYAYRLWRYFGTLNTEFPYFAWLGAVGLCGSFIRRSGRKRTLLIFLLFLFSLLPVMTYAQTGPILRAHFYYPSYMFVSILIGMGTALILKAVVRVFGGRNTVVRYASIGLIAAILLAPVFCTAHLHYAKVDKSDYPYAEKMAREMFAAAEPGSLILTASDNVFFPMKYMQVVERLRSDIRVVNPESVGVPGFPGVDLLVASTGGRSRFEPVADNGLRKYPTYSSSPEQIIRGYDAAWEGHLLRLHAQDSSPHDHRPGKPPEMDPDLDSDARESVLLPWALFANQQLSRDEYRSAAETLGRTLSSFQKEMYVPTLYSCGTYANLYDFLGFALNRTGDYRETVGRLPWARKLNPDFHSVNLATAYMKTGDLKSAIEECEGFLMFQPDNGPVRRMAGDILYRLGRNQEALAQLERAIMIDPRDAAAHFLAAESLISLGREKEAATHYRKVIELDARGALSGAAEKRLQRILDRSARDGGRKTMP